MGHSLPPKKSVDFPFRLFTHSCFFFKLKPPPSLFLNMPEISLPFVLRESFPFTLKRNLMYPPFDPPKLVRQILPLWFFLSGPGNVFFPPFDPQFSPPKNTLLMGKGLGTSFSPQFAQFPNSALSFANCFDPPPSHHARFPCPLSMTDSGFFPSLNFFLTVGTQVRTTPFCL